MSVDPRRLRDLASQTGFRAETLERVIRLGEIAGDVARHPLLSRALVLKGGRRSTCASVSRSPGKSANCKFS